MSDKCGACSHPLDEEGNCVNVLCEQCEGYIEDDDIDFDDDLEVEDEGLDEDEDDEDDPYLGDDGTVEGPKED